MTVTLELKPEVEEQLEAQARESGLSVKDYLEKRVEEMISTPRSHNRQKLRKSGYACGMSG
jgi:hypothetical protein